MELKSKDNLYIQNTKLERIHSPITQNSGSATTQPQQYTLIHTHLEVTDAYSCMHLC